MYLVDKETDWRIYHDKSIKSKFLEVMDVVREHLFQNEYNFGGRKVLSPRLNCWIGDVGYHYSGQTNPPSGTLEDFPLINNLLIDTCKKLKISSLRYNSCLVNFYRNQKDSVTWHADDEKEIRGSILSISIGETRRFCFKHKESGEQYNYDLQDGDIIWMSPDCQKNWVHCIPKEKLKRQGRINLTFRHIVQ